MKQGKAHNFATYDTYDPLKEAVFLYRFVSMIIYNLKRHLIAFISRKREHAAKKMDMINLTPQ